VGRSWVEVAVLAGSAMLMLVVELLNSSVEAAIDRVSFDLHPLSKRAKDLGSAAVFLSVVMCVAIWCGALWQRWGG
jgi:diacylglycerol kinase (ATP)